MRSLVISWLLVTSREGKALKVGGREHEQQRRCPRGWCPQRRVGPQTSPTQLPKAAGIESSKGPVHTSSRAEVPDPGLSGGPWQHHQHPQSKNSRLRTRGRHVEEGKTLPQIRVVLSPIQACYLQVLSGAQATAAHMAPHRFWLPSPEAPAPVLGRGHQGARAKAPPTLLFLTRWQ